MSLMLPEKSDFEVTPSGSHVAVCYRVIDFGTQLIEWKGEKKTQHKIMISWELPNEIMTRGENIGKPFSVHKQYTLSSSDKATLKKDLESWRGQAFTNEQYGKFDITVLIGKACMLGVIHTEREGKTFANITSIMRLPSGMTTPPLISKPIKFTLSDFNKEVYESLSDGLKAKIAKSPEFQEIIGANRVDPNMTDAGDHQAANSIDPLDDTIPF